MSDGVETMASPDFIKNALSKALGPDKAKELGASMAQTEDMGLEALKFIDPVMISNYIRTEHPQTIALIISYLADVDQAATVLRTLLKISRPMWFIELPLWTVFLRGWSMNSTKC